MRLQKAKPYQLDAIVDLIGRAVVKMESQGIFQWNAGYPSKDIFIQDLELHNLYVVVQANRIVACLTLNQLADPRYDEGDFAYHGPDYIVVHRFCVEPEMQHQGIGKRSLMLLERRARKQGFQAIWLDASTKNPYSNRLYLGCGFKLVGSFSHAKGRTNMYEKLL